MNLRWYFKCPDCLSPIALDLERAPGWNDKRECGACGGALESMGQVRGNRWAHKETLCKCDDRCVCATGPNCDCSCLGENHGAQMLGFVEVVTESGIVRATPRDAEAAARIAAEWRTAMLDVKGAIARLPRHAEYAAREFIPRGDWDRLRYAYDRLAHVRGMRSHSGRMKSVGELLASVSARAGIFA